MAIRKSARIGARLLQKKQTQDLEQPLKNNKKSGTKRQVEQPKRRRQVGPPAKKRRKDAAVCNSSKATKTKLTPSVKVSRTPSVKGSRTPSVKVSRTPKDKISRTPCSRSREAKQLTPKSSRGGERRKKNAGLQGLSVQFDYGVPSPIEDERVSIDDDSASQTQEVRKSQRKVIARTKQGHSIHITLDPPKTFTFKSEQARKLWEAATEERGDLIKRLIENNELVPDWLKRQLEGSLELTKAQTRDILNEDRTRRSGTQGLVWLQLEEKVLDLDNEIRSCLKRDFGNVDLDRCISSLEKLLRCPVDPLMLKKYPDLARTPYSLQRYNGNLTHWTLSDEQKELFCSKRAAMWDKAKSLQQKYMSMFGITDYDKYLEEFQLRLHTFLNAVVDLTEDEVSQLTHEPTPTPNRKSHGKIKRQLKIVV